MHPRCSSFISPSLTLCGWEGMEEDSPSSQSWRCQCSPPQQCHSLSSVCGPSEVLPAHPGDDSDICWLSCVLPSFHDQHKGLRRAAQMQTRTVRTDESRARAISSHVWPQAMKWFSEQNRTLSDEHIHQPTAQSDCLPRITKKLGLFTFFSPNKPFSERGMNKHSRHVSTFDKKHRKVLHPLLKVIPLQSALNVTCINGLKNMLIC